MKQILLYLQILLLFLAPEKIFADTSSTNEFTFATLYNSKEWQRLLHYNNGKSIINKNSDFFLSDNGYKNPKEEFDKTVGLLQNIDESKCSVFCRYPARASFILANSDAVVINNQNHHCEFLDQYSKIVYPEKIYLVFAAENNSSPMSMMGHSFLRIDGKGKSHSFNYSAFLEKESILKICFKALSTGVTGYYTLFPYSKSIDRYVHTEKRSLWEFELNLSEEEKRKLVNHMWELKEKDISYKFISHNCNTALMSILSVMGEKFAVNTYKPFITPVEYIQELYERGLIKEISFVPSEHTKKILQKSDFKLIIDAPQPTRISINYDVKNDVLGFVFSPVYQDILDVSNAYFSELQTKLLELVLLYDCKQDKLLLDRLDVFKTIAIGDYFLTKDLSTSFRLGFENDVFSEKNEFAPIIELGRGIGYKFNKSTIIYGMFSVGYHYDDISNFYFYPQFGLMANLFDDLKIFTSYETYWDFNENNKGFKSKIDTNLIYKINDSFSLSINYSYFEKAKNNDSLKLSLKYYF